MSGTWNKVLPSRVSDDHMSFMARCALAHGCKAISWFMFHDRECWGDAPVSSHGHRRTNLYVLRDTYDLCMHRIRGWDSLRVMTDVAVLYDLVQHRHTSVGDSSPCDDSRVHEGAPMIRGVRAGTATKEYVALFRLVEHVGCQAGVVDLLERPEALDGYRVAFLPGSPIIEREVNDRLLRWTASGGTLVVSGAWPQVDEAGRALCFLGVSGPGAQPVGNGRVIHHAQPLGSHTEPEKDDLSAIEFVSDLIARHHGKPHVKISPESPVHWVDWGENGGLERYDQPRSLGSAIIQQNETGERLLFVLNHYPEAARFLLEFREKPDWLVCLDTGNRIAVSDGTVALDIDRKSCCVYRLLKNTR